MVSKFQEWKAQQDPIEAVSPHIAESGKAHSLTSTVVTGPQRPQVGGEVLAYGLEHWKKSMWKGRLCCSHLGKYNLPNA